MKFFVVKVNLEKKPMVTDGYLRPLQIRFEHERFMLPIRLGMANGNGEQDMLVYAFSKKGRIETTNYRTVKVPTDRKIPLYIKQRFDTFYGDLFRVAHRREGRNAVFLEYAWDLSPYNYAKCDPCVGEVPDYNDMVTAGVDWLKAGSGINQSAKVYFTRLHVRYGRKKFPQDLVFMETPNKENFQGRYILTHPATGDLSCAEGQKYLTELHNRRLRENAELASLTGWKMDKYAYYPKEFDDLIKIKNASIETEGDTGVYEDIDEDEGEGDVAPTSLPEEGQSDHHQQNWEVLFYIALGLFALLGIFQVRLFLRKRAKE